MSRFVPYLHEETIEQDAASLIAEFEHARGTKIKLPIPIEDIVEKHLKLRLEFDDMHARHDVPRPPNGETDILGAIYSDGSVCIDQSLDPEDYPDREGRYRFTLAHEGGGHGRLHKHLIMQDTAQASYLDQGDGPSFLCRLSQAKERVEWQADFYASCLLMPRAFVDLAWRLHFGTSEPFIFALHKNNPAFKYRSAFMHVSEAAARALGEEGQSDSLYAFNKIARDLAGGFRVSREAMRIRLEQLGYLLVDEPRQLSVGFQR